ncbi:MAG: hypothetical protein PHH40_04320 [Candidatus Moranbacteria bacterium]|nr:hypothetical protein [Candidatus Moranbacteria bacterium]MDD3964537.1 hypothetical protein [Candidatus Moranbacteria bacterium]
MKHSFFTIQRRKSSLSVRVISLSPTLSYIIFLAVSLTLTGLLYVSSLSVNQLYADLPVDAPNPHLLLEQHVRTVVDGYPIERMAPLIATHDKMTASFLVAIAKKESNWGKRVPVDESGNDCFNYWGYRGAGSRGIEMGHGCFGSRREAVAVVGKRIDTLVKKYELKSPEEFIVWKCGWNCSGHSSTSVQKWINDVEIYFDKVYN